MQSDLSTQFMRNINGSFHIGIIGKIGGDPELKRLMDLKLETAWPADSLRSLGRVRDNLRNRFLTSQYKSMVDDFS